MRYGIDEYARMLGDPVRGGAYLRAIRETVRPGSVVADIGSGPGVLGVYAATLGARKVYLIDPDQSVRAGKALADENGVGDRVEVIRDLSSQVELPERADVIVSDLRGVTPFDGNHLATAADMRRRLLAPGGTCIPHRDVVWTALVEDGAMHDRTCGAWSFLPDALAHRSLDELVANTWYKTRATGQQLLSEPSEFVKLAYDTDAPRLVRTWETTATRDGTVHGLLLWFDTDLVQGIAFSNAPFAPPALYGQAFFPFNQPIPAERDDRFTIEMRAVAGGGDYLWHWAVTAPSGQQQSHTNLRGMALDVASLHRRSERFIPRRSADADFLASLLAEADGATTLGELATRLHHRHARRFPTVQSALDFASQFEDFWEPEDAPG